MNQEKESFHVIYHVYVYDEKQKCLKQKKILSKVRTSGSFQEYNQCYFRVLQICISMQTMGIFRRSSKVIIVESA